MSICKNEVYWNSVERAALSFDYTGLHKKAVLITGATGLIGSAIVDMLLWLNDNANTCIQIFAASRDPNKIYKRFEGFSEKNGLYAIEYDACQKVNFDFPVDYIIHAASNATPDVYIKYPVETMLGNVLGIRELLEYAVKVNVTKTVYVSSSEVYGIQKRSSALKENEYGITDLLSPRSSYPVGKQASETLCICYSKQYNCDVSIVRPGHIYGPTANANDQRVSSAFARLAASGQNIIMKSTGEQLRSYCHCLDCATAILTVLLKGENGQAYNISNKNSIITIREMAELLARHGQVSIINDFPSESEKAAFNPMTNSSLNSEKLEALGWEGIFSAEEGVKITVDVMRSIIDMQKGTPNAK